MWDLRMVFVRPVLGAFAAAVAIGLLAFYGGFVWSLVSDGEYVGAAAVTLFFIPGLAVAVGALLRAVVIVTKASVRGAWPWCKRVEWNEIRGFASKDGDTTLGEVIVAVKTDGDTAEVAQFPFLTFFEFPNRHRARFERVIGRLEAARPPGAETE